MALSAKVVQIAQPASTGNQATTGVGFTPKFIFLFGNGETADGSDTSNMRFQMGIGVSATDRRTGAVWQPNASSSTYSGTNDTKCYLVTSSGPGIQAAADLVSLDSDGFTLNWTTVDATARKVNVLCVGGSDLTNVKSGEFLTATATGNQAVTGVGFKPDSLMLFQVDWANTIPITENHHGEPTVGFGTSSTSRAFGTAGWNQTGSANNANSYQRTNGIVSRLVGTAIQQEADLVSLDSDGFTINWSTANSTGRQLFYLALKGGSFAVGSFNQPASTGNAAVTGTGFTPAALMLVSDNFAAATTVQTNARMSLGVATSTAQRYAIWAGGADGGSTGTNDNENLDSTKVIKLMTEGTPTVNAAADLASFDSNGFTLNWTSADATARQILYFALGSAASNPAPNVNDSSAVTESTTVEIVYLVNVNDSSAATENVAALYVRCPNVSDSSTVTNVIVQMLQTYLPNVQESLAVSENIVLLQTKFVSVFDSSNVVENFGNALRFNAATASPSDNWSSVTDNFTMIAWIRPTIPQSPSTSIIAYNGDDNGGWGIGIVNSSHFIALYGGSGAPGFIDPGLVLVNNQIYHVALVRRSGRTYLYVNGTETDTGVTSAPNTPTVGWASVGFQYDSSDNTSRFYLGDLDELKVYARAYSAADITTDYNSGKGTYGYSTDASIVALYHMDEGTGATASDPVGGDTLALSITSWIPSFVPGYETVEIVDRTSVFDSSAATDVLTQILQIYTISVSDSSTATDTLIAVYNPPQVFDSSTVTDSIVQILILDFEILNDSSVVTDSPSMLITTPGGGVSVLEITAPTESLIVQSGSMWNISVNDTPIATDAPGVLVLTPPRQIGWIDFSTITESFVVQAGTFFSTFDSSQATDVATVAVPLLGPINVFDSPIATENTPYQYIQQESLANSPTTGIIKDNASWQGGGWIQLTPSINNQHGEFEYSPATTFVTQQNSTFMLNDQRFRSVAVNKYPLIVNQMSQADIATFFVACATIGISVVRTWCFDTQGFRNLFYPVGTNLISNPSFETDTSGWTLGADYTRTNADAEDGSWSIGQVSAGGYANLNTQVTLATNTNYALTFWYKMSNPSGFAPVVFVGTTVGANDIKDGGFNSDTGGIWIKKQILFNSGANTSAYLTFSNFGGTATGFFDNISISQPGATPVLEASEGMLRQTDLVLNEARKHGIKLILSLMDGNENNYNSKSQYVQWANAIYGDTFSNSYPYLDFFTSAHCQTIYKGFVDLITSRVNFYNGLTYKNDGTIFSWELGNELRTNSFESGSVVNTLNSTNLAILSNPHIDTSGGSNIITNTTFETNTNGWTLGSAFSRSNDTAEDGLWSIKQVSSFDTYDSLAYQATVVPNTTYTWTVWYKLTNTAGGPGQLPTRQVVGTSAGNNDVADGGFFGNTASWVQKTMTFNSGGNTTIYLSIQNWGGQNSGYFDNITLVPQPNNNGWADIMSTYIKSKDPNHMIGFGDMGHTWQWVQGDTVSNGTYYGVDYNILSALPNISYLDFHTYPTQGDNVHLQEFGQRLGFPDAISGAGYRAQLQDYVNVGKANGKPVVCGEVGFIRETIGDNTYYPLYPRVNTFSDIFSTFFGAGGDIVALWHGEVGDGGSYSVNLVDWNGDTTNQNYNDTPVKTLIRNQNTAFALRPTANTLPASFEALFDINVVGQADAIYFYWGCVRTPLNELDNAGGYIFALDEFVSANTPYLLNFNGTIVSSQGTITWNDGIWHSVRLEVAGTTVTAFLDNVQKFSFVDSSRSLGGSLYGWGSRTGGQNATHNIRNTQIATLAPVKVIETTFFPTIITDSSTVTDSANVALVQCPTVFDSSTVTDVPALFLPVLKITTFDSSTVTDVIILPFQIIAIVMPSSVSGEHFGIRVWTP